MRLKIALLVLFLAHNGFCADGGNRYSAIHDLDIGALSIRAIRIQTSVIRKRINDDEADVQITFSGGVLSLACGPAEIVCVSGIVSTRNGSTSVIEGHFKWSNQTLSSLKVDHFRTDIESASCKCVIIGGRLALNPSTLVHLENDSSLNFGTTNDGTLLIKGRGGVDDAKLNLAGVGAMASLKAVSAMQVSLNLLDGSAAVHSGILSAVKTEIGNSDQTSSFFPNLKYSGGKSVFKAIRWNAASNALTIASLVIEQPVKVEAINSQTPVTATKRIISADLRGNVTETREALNANHIEFGDVRAIPDSEAVINLLNQRLSSDPDALVPTGDSQFQFISLRALDNFYTSIGQARQDPKTLYQIHLASHGGVISDSSVELIPVPNNTTASASSGTHEPYGLAKVCVIFEGDYAETAASMGVAVAVTYVATLVAPGARRLEGAIGNTAIGQQVMAAVGKINPRIAAGVLTPVVGATGIWKETQIGRLGKSIIHSAHENCELLLGSSLGQKTIQLPEFSDGPSASYEAESAARYNLYLQSAQGAGIPMRVVDPVMSRTITYNRMEQARQSAWQSKQKVDIEKARAEESKFSQQQSAAQASVAAGNIAATNSAVRQGQLSEATRRAIEDTPIFSIPTGSPGPSDPHQYYIRVEP